MKLRNYATSQIGKLAAKLTENCKNEEYNAYWKFEIWQFFCLIFLIWIVFSFLLWQFSILPIFNFSKSNLWILYFPKCQCSKFFTFWIFSISIITKFRFSLCLFFLPVNFLNFPNSQFLIFFPFFNSINFYK